MDLEEANFRDLAQRSEYNSALSLDSVGSSIHIRLLYQA